MRLVVGPHLDDAVLGAGAYLSLSREPVLTVFDGVPPGADMIATDYDRSCGFATAGAAMGVRREENDRALAMLGCESIGLGMLDWQYSRGHQPKGTTARAIREAMEGAGAEGLVAPLGIQHPDHVHVSEACLMLATMGTPVWLYEELPYRVVWPEAAHERHAELAARGWVLVPDFLGAGDSHAKEAAVACYASQELDPHCCLVPERHWAALR